MRVTIVGSGTLLPDDRHRSPGHLIEWSGGKLLLDCGSGVLHGLARDGLDWRAIGHVVLSHYHTDHIGDLAPLFWAWAHGVPPTEVRSRTILGPPGLRSVLAGLAAAHGFLSAEGTLQVVELPRDGHWVDADSGLVIRTHPAVHTPESVLVRVEVERTAVGYTGDTGLGPRVANFFQGTDLLICECGAPDDAKVPIHLSPTEVAELARGAAPGRLVLTHLHPSHPRESLASRLAALGVTVPVVVAEDGFSIEL